jgi:hypothetical protein
VQKQSLHPEIKQTLKLWRDSPYILWLNGPKTTEQRVWTYSGRMHMISMMRDHTSWIRRDLRPVKREPFLWRNWTKTYEKKVQTFWDLWRVKRHLNILKPNWPQTYVETVQASCHRTNLGPTKGDSIHLQTEMRPAKRESVVVSEGPETERRQYILRQTRLHAYHVTTTMMMIMITLMQFSLQYHVFRFKFKSNVCIAKWSMAPHHLVRHSNESLLGLWCE